MSDPKAKTKYDSTELTNRMVKNACTIREFLDRSMEADQSQKGFTSDYGIDPASKYLACLQFAQINEIVSLEGPHGSGPRSGGFMLGPAGMLVPVQEENGADKKDDDLIVVYRCQNEEHGTSREYSAIRERLIRQQPYLTIPLNQFDDYLEIGGVRLNVALHQVETQQGIHMVMHLVDIFAKSVHQDLSFDHVAMSGTMLDIVVSRIKNEYRKPLITAMVKTVEDLLQMGLDDYQQDDPVRKNRISQIFQYYVETLVKQVHTSE